MANFRVALFSCPIAEIFDGEVVSTGQDSYNDTPQLGIFVLAGALRDLGCDIELVDLSARKRFRPEDIEDLAADADALLFSTNSLNWATVRWVAGILRPRVRGVMALGGPHATLYPEYVAGSGLFDVVWSGDALNATATLVSLLRETRRGDGKARIVSAAALPPPTRQVAYNPAFDLLKTGTYCAIPVETSRGCKFQCTFCSIPSKRSWVPSDVEESVRRIELTAAHIGSIRHDRISIIDDTFTTDRERVRAIFSRLDPERFAKKIYFDATAVDLLDENFVATVEPYTCDLLVGAEVSSKEDAKRIKKAATPDILSRAAANLKKSDLAKRAVFSFIIGFPWQSKDDCLRTIGFAADMIANYGVTVYLQWYWPIPGSQLWRELESDGKVSLSMVEKPGFFRDPTLFFRTRGISLRDVEEIDSRVKPLQLLFAAIKPDGNASPLAYSPPPLKGHVWQSRRRGDRLEMPMGVA